MKIFKMAVKAPTFRFDDSKISSMSREEHRRHIADSASYEFVLDFALSILHGNYPQDTKRRCFSCSRRILSEIKKCKCRYYFCLRCSFPEKHDCLYPAEGKV
ncbi:MAG: hypothetical protein GWP59_08950 [Chlamydiales bacterium]|nr:hypothetical protein [Chlamydiales bacterium]NCF71813.1 hypothetical protein [Chlamydiales bacterium]